LVPTPEQTLQAVGNAVCLSEKILGGRQNVAAQAKASSDESSVTAGDRGRENCAKRTAFLENLL